MFQLFIDFIIMLLYYVYKITNLNPTTTEYLYIGVHSDENPDSLNDVYWKSSRPLKRPMKLEGIANFKKEVLSYWATRKEAVQEEIRLHNLDDVVINETYYIKSKQTSTKFDTSGNKEVGEKTRQGNLTVGKDGLTGYERSVKKLKITINNPEWKSTVGVEQSQKQKATKNSKEWKETVGKDESLKISKTRKDKGLAKGSKNTNAKRIKILNADGNICYTTHGNFKNTCDDNNLPYHALMESIKKLGTHIFSTHLKRKRAIGRGGGKYIG